MEIRLIALLIVIISSINLIRMTVFLVGSDIYHARFARKRRDNLSYFPSFSIIIPAHNEQGTIIRAIKSVVQSTYSGYKEAVVVDDGSSDNTSNIVSKFIEANPNFNITLVSQLRLGKAHALNNGIKNYSKGELVMCLDADSYLNINALDNAASYFEDSSVVALSSNVKIIQKKGMINTLQVYEYLICHQMKRAESLFNCKYIVGGIGSVFRRSKLEEVGYYDTNTVTEDIDVTMKMLQDGNKKNKVVFGADVVTYTEAVLSVSGLISQRFRWKWGRYQTFLKNKNMFFSTDRKYTKGMTWFYLPFALYGDISFTIEPILLFYISLVSIYYRDPAAFLSAFIVGSLYIVLNVLSEDTLSPFEKIKFIAFSPVVYVFFYVLSFVEYMALIKSLVKLPWLRESLNEGCSWNHVARPIASPSLS